MSYKIIVSRYNEDINWTNDFSNVLIYNKGEPLNISNEIILNNVGREGHTYYTHIYDNYDNLDDYLFFFQGNPYDHSPNLNKNLKRIIELIEKYNNNYNDNEILKSQLNFNFLSEIIYNTTIKHVFTGLFLCENIYNSYEKIFNKKIDDKTIKFGAGAQFIVSKTTILKRPREFYYNIIKLLDYSIDPNEGHDIERFHNLIFTDFD